MGENTAIEWADHTFNPWIGCTKVSPACDHCYAERLATARLGVAWGPHADRRRTAESTWRQPLAWNRKAEREGKRPRVFCASLADVFDNQVPEAWRLDLWHLIHLTPHLDWLLLTKRPQNIARMLPQPATLGFPAWGRGWPNVRLGITAENQDEFDRRAPVLHGIPAQLDFFVSCEPLLGPIAFGPWVGRTPGAVGGIGWVIAGGESGPEARPSHPDWFRSLRDQCSAAGVPFFFKQWGEWLPGTQYTDELRDRDEDAFSRFACMDWDGEWRSADGMLGDELSGDETYRVGKKAAGARLDGRWHRLVPGA